MRRIILIIIASIMFANIGFAEISLIEKSYIRYDSALGDGPTSVSTFCVDGYKFILVQATRSSKAVSLDLKQIFEERNGQSLPAKC